MTGSRKDLDDEFDKMIFKLGAWAGAIVTLLMIIGLVLGIIWLAKQVF